MSYPPTDEQQAAIDIAAAGENCVIEALAGTGKTSTLRMLSDEMPDTRIAYVAFNKSIVTEAQGKFPSNVTASTAHSLAFREVGKEYADRLKGGRMRSDQIARLIRVDPMQVEAPGGRKRLAAGFLAGIVKRSIDIFCQTADETPGMAHLPSIPGIDPPKVVNGPNGPEAVNDRRGPNFLQVARALEPAQRRYWADINSLNGELPFFHGHYLKIWQLSQPRIFADMILYDEAQDANPCMLSIVNEQRHAQLVFVGDTYQQIYGWNGAINALESADPSAPRTWLTRSFRFGPEVAEVANRVLLDLGAPVKVEGAGAPGVVGRIDDPNVVLFRTNAKAVSRALAGLRDGKRVCVVGGAQDVIFFAEGAKRLMETGWSHHPDLQCFSTWGEVQDYVEFDPSGSELQLLVKLVDEFGVDQIIDGLGKCSQREDTADLVVSTSHKSKGREWESVQLGPDFPDPKERDLADEDKRLLYVAATRAMRSLDVTQVAYFAEGDNG